MNIIPALVIFSLSLFSKTFSVRLCGKQLADMLDLVCDGRGFNVMHNARKFSTQAFDNNKTITNSLLQCYMCN